MGKGGGGKGTLDKYIGRQTDRQTDTHTGRHIVMQREVDRYTDIRQTDIQKDRQIIRQIDKQTIDKQAAILIDVYYIFQVRKHLNRQGKVNEGFEKENANGYA